jgi:uncharacterized phiE125 gp8 family phage protein
MIRQDKASLCVGLSELQAFLRVETGEEEALLAGLLRSASEVCETFLNQALLSRGFQATVPGGPGWTLLQLQPVQTITSVHRSASGEMLPQEGYRCDIDYEGRGLVAGLPPGETYVVSGTAGMASDANAVPEPIRQGILRLAAHMFANRDGEAGPLPAAVTVLWRPFRRAGLCR